MLFRKRQIVFPDPSLVYKDDMSEGIQQFEKHYLPLLNNMTLVIKDLSVLLKEIGDDDPDSLSKIWDQVAALFLDQYFVVFDSTFQMQRD